MKYSVVIVRRLPQSVIFRLYVNEILALSGTNSVLSMTTSEFENFKQRLGATES